MTRSKLLSGIAAAALLYAVPVGSVLPTQMAGVAAVLPGPSAAQAQNVNVDINFFFDRLEPHGSWVRHDRHRYVWVPDGIDRDWAPYTEGRWVYVRDYGWTFISDEPFGWATYHYGRWAFDRDIGWYWVPGTRWAPAWVSWRRGPDYVGWAPLPPEGDGFAVSIEVSIGDIPEDRWYFVPADDFLVADLRTVLIPARQRPVFYERSEYVGNVVIYNNVYVNTVIDIDFIRERSDEEVTVYNVQNVDDPEAADTASPEGETIPIFAPAVSEPAGEVQYEEAVEPEVVAEKRQEEGVVPAEGEGPATEAEGEPEAGETSDAGDPAAEPGSAEAEAETEASAGADASAGDVMVEGEAEAEATTGAEADAAPQPEAPASGETATPAPAESTAAPATEAEAEAEAEANVDAGPAEAEAAAEGTAEAEAAAEAPVTSEPVPPAQPAEPTPPAETAPAEAAPAPAETAPAPEAEAPEAEAAPEAEPAPAPAAEEAAPADAQPPAGECTPEQQAAGRC